MKVVGLIGTFDTKGREFSYLKKLLEERGLGVLCIDVGVFEPQFTPDICSEEVAAAAEKDIHELVERRDRAAATEALSNGLEKLLPQLYAQGRLDGVLSAGGSGGTALATPAMRALPIGVPKIMISTMASGNVSQYVGDSDIIMMPSIVDVEGLNQISRKVFGNAVNAISGMLDQRAETEETGKPLLAATMFGVTTPCIKEAKAYLEEQGYEVLVFHATGAGGRTMEALIDGGYIKGVLDITTTEWCDEIVGGVLTAGSHRLEAAGRNAVPQVVSVGALDMVNFGPWDTVPERFKKRKLYRHNPMVTLMRTTPEEVKKIGEAIAEKLNKAVGKTALILPLRGISAIDVEGGPFFDAQADKVLFDTLRDKVASHVELIEVEQDINSPEFARKAAEKLIDYLR